MMRGFLYSLPEIAVNGIETFLRLYLILFYTQSQGLDPKLAGLAMGVATFWDAVTDPLVGKWSDQIRIKKGRRDHLFLIGGLLTSGLLLSLFYFRAFDSQAALFSYLLLGMILLSSATTFFSVPYSALIGDFQLTAQQRGQFVGWRLGMANFGALLGLAVPGLLILKNPDGFYFETAVVFAVTTSALAIIVFLIVQKWPRENFQHVKADSSETWRTHLKDFKNNGFLNLLGAFFVANIGLTLNSSLALLYYRNWLQLPESQIQSVLIIFFILFSISIPLWLYLSRSNNKVKVGSIGILLLGITNCLVYLIIPPGSFIITVLGASVLGGLLVGSYVLLESHLIDTIKKYDEIKKQNSFGLIYGIWKMSGKVSRGFALFLTGIVLSEVLKSSGSDVSSPELLAYFFGPGVGIFFIFAALLIFQKKSKVL